MSSLFLRQVLQTTWHSLACKRSLRAIKLLNLPWERIPREVDTLPNYSIYQQRCFIGIISFIIVWSFAFRIYRLGCVVQEFVSPKTFTTKPKFHFTHECVHRLLSDSYYNGFLVPSDLGSTLNLPGHFSQHLQPILYTITPAVTMIYKVQNPSTHR